jgi:transcriptional regulator with XRE-family HTH domain
MMLHMDAEAAQPDGTERPEDDFWQAFGARLAQLRGGKGWSQRELSRRAGIDPGRLSRLERGVARVTAAELVRFSKALGAGLDEIVFGAAGSPQGEWHRLLRELERTGPRAIDCGIRLLRALVLGFEPGARESHGPV